jgi:hypothetical protein
MPASDALRNLKAAAEDLKDAEELPVRGKDLDEEDGAERGARRRAEEDEPVRCVARAADSPA